MSCIIIAQQCLLRLRMERKLIERIEKRIQESERKIQIWEKTASEHQKKLLSPSLSEWKRCDLELQVQWREQAIEDVKDTIAKYEERLSELNFNSVQLCDPKIRTERGRIQKRIAELKEKIKMWGKSTAYHQKLLLKPSLGDRKRQELEFRLQMRQHNIKKKEESITKYERKLEQLTYPSKGSIKEIDSEENLSEGIDINSIDESYNFALLEASKHGHADRVAVLLQSPYLEVNSQNNDGYTALMKASLNGFIEVVRLLLEKGARVDLQDKQGRSALLHASSNGHIHVVQMLLENGAQVDLRDDNGRSALLHASSKGHLLAVEMLLEKDAQIDLQDNRGWTPLMKAYQNGHEDVIASLLSKNADVDLENNEGKNLKGMVLDRNCLTEDPAYEGILFSKGPQKISISPDNRIIDLEEEIGISLSFPEKSLPPTDSSLEFYIRPCFSGPFELPEHYTFMSPVYIIEPSREVEFREKVTVRINHHAYLQSEEDCEDMVFLTASTTPEHRESGPVYVFRETQGAEGLFKPGEEQPFGEVKLNHFCMKAVGNRTEGQSIYSARLYYNKENLALLCVFPSTHAMHCDDAISTKYREMTIYNSHNCVSINSDEVMIEPVNNRHWEIVFLKEPALINKTEIEYQKSYQKIEELLKLDYPSNIKMTVCSVASRTEYLKLQVTGLNCTFVLLPDDFKSNGLLFGDKQVDTASIKSAMTELEEEIYKTQCDSTIKIVAKEMLEGVKLLEKYICFYSDKHPSSATEVLIKMEERSRKLRSLAKEALQQFKITYFMEVHMEDIYLHATELKVLYSSNYSEKATTIIPTIKNLIVSITKLVESSRNAYSLPNNQIIPLDTPPTTPIHKVHIPFSNTTICETVIRERSPIRAVSSPRKCIKPQTVCSILRPLRADWQDIGFKLELDDGYLKEIEHRYQDSKDALREMILLWFRIKEPTWSELVDVIEIDYPKEARIIRNTYMH